MTKPLVSIALAATLLTGAPALAGPRGHGPRGHAVGHARHVYVAPVYVAPHYYRPYYYRPYYAFRPRFSIGFGITVGYPVAYPVYAPYYYPSPSPYRYPAPPPYASGYPAPSPPQPYSTPSYPLQTYPSYRNNSIAAQPRSMSSASDSAGVSFEVSPSDATVFVDGRYAGTVDQFGPQTEPLRLAPGRHRIELRASGLRPVAFDTTIAAGQVMPYRGALQ